MEFGSSEASGDKDDDRMAKGGRESGCVEKINEIADFDIGGHKHIFLSELLNDFHFPIGSREFEEGFHFFACSDVDGSFHFRSHRGRKQNRRALIRIGKCVNDGFQIGGKGL